MRRQESLGYVINHVARQFARALHREISPLGVVPGQFAQLLTLYERDGLTQQELCDFVQIEQPTMANTLRRMERDGLITREPHPSDGRKQVISLTEKARELEPELVAAARRINAAAVENLTREERRKLMDVLGSLSVTMGDAYPSSPHRPEEATDALH